MSLVSKWFRAFRIIRQHGGPFKGLNKLWKMETLKEGKNMGSDANGNRYFENPNYMIGRSRWVEFNPLYRFEYDASHISPEWYGWLHYKTDRIPSEDWAKYCINSCEWYHHWLLRHKGNLTGTQCAFYPFRTTKNYVNVWDGYCLTNRSA